ncbi:hypothetical protein BUALT_Bualt10G0111000 [Buddleja alternifolia]|uniref:Pentatricopeptide repeat-containing protein n=1 Tax=Buddleja alternifolia TaxID=168488 RepID=A0AAV6WYI5_9LAMI|nr:hypothetical protein BUALT_Bualt10G0111000 [Buddleja alternifolia]
MAAARSRVSLPIFRAKNRAMVTESGRRLARLIIQKRDSSSAASTDIPPLLQKLLNAPDSRIKLTLDSEFTSELPEFPWAALLTSLHSSAPQKANLVIEWKLEKLTKENGKNHNCYTQLISLCENIRNLPIALHIFTSMEAQGVKPTSSVFNALISTSLSSGNLLTALSLFEIMEASEDYKPDSDTYNTFISSYAKTGNRNATEAWVTAKKSSGFSVDAKTYDYLIQCCLKSKKFEDAQRYYEEMVLAELMPNESILRNMLMMFCQQRNFGRVKEFLNFILDGNWRVGTNMVKKIAGLYHEVGKVEDLEEFIVILTKSNQSLEVLSLAHSLIIRMYADRDRLDDVEYCVGRMLKDGIAFSCTEDVEKVICSYFRKEAYDRLDLFLECIKDSYKISRSTYELLGAGYRRAGLSERLNILVNEMKVAGFL